jgi:hypothetical protein
LKEWILYETGLDVREYSKRMMRGSWGGTIEAQILSDFLKRPVGIYALKGRSANLITEIKPSQCALKAQNEKAIFVLYNGRSHYDGLV